MWNHLHDYNTRNKSSPSTLKKISFSLYHATRTTATSYAHIIQVDSEARSFFTHITNTSEVVLRNADLLSIE